MTQALSGFGTLLKIGDGGTPTENFTTIAEVTDITAPGLTMDVIDVTSHDSPDALREKIAGLKDLGECTFTINYIPTHATHNATTGLIRDWKNRTKRNFKLVFPDAGATTWSFSGFVTNFQPSAPVDDKLTADVTITLSGQDLVLA